MNEWIVIPVHNRRNVTLECLAHLAETGDLSRFRVLVVDDGSSDGTTESIRQRFPEVLLARGNGDLWWTGAIALGMDEAFRQGASGVCWLNDDCLPEPGTLPALVEWGQRLGAIVSPLCVRSDTHARVPTAFVGRLQIHADKGCIEVDGVSGFCVRVPREVWLKIGAPDARRFPHYYGDTSYTLAAKKAGVRSYLLADYRAQLVRYEPRPESVSEHLRRAAPAAANWTALFLSPKSPFRIPTLFWYFIAKYGPTTGAALFAARALQGQLKWGAHVLAGGRRKSG